MRALLFTLLGAAAIAAPSVAAPLASDAEAIARAQTFLNRLDAGQFDAALQDAAPTLREALPATKLAQVWQALPKQVGAAGPRGTPRVEHHDASRLVIVPLPYANMALEGRIDFDASGALDGFFIAPAAPLTPAETTPAVATNDRYSESELHIGPSGKELGATLTLPRGDGPFPAVVLVHGSGPHDRDETIGPNKPFRDLAHGLAERGIAVLRYDKRTLMRPQDFIGRDFNVDDELTNDALSAAERLRSTAHIDPHRIVIAGHSLGAMMAPRIGQRAPWLAGLVLLAAPARPLQEIVPGQRRYIAALDGQIDAQEQKEIDLLDTQRAEIREFDSAHPPKHSLMLNLPPAYWADIRSWDPIAVALTLKQPLLLLQGGRDYQVRPDTEFVRWQRSFATMPRASFIEYPTLSHLFMPGSEPPRPSDYDRAGHVDAKVIADIADWILRNTANKPD